MKRHYKRILPFICLILSLNILAAPIQAFAGVQSDPGILNSTFLRAVDENTRAIYTMEVTHSAYYTYSSGVIASINASCSDRSCSIKSISGTVRLRDLDDYDYGTYNLYVSSLVPASSLTASTGTGVKSEYGIPSLFLEFNYEINLVSGTILDGKYRSYTFGPISVPAQ